MLPKAARGIKPALRKTDEKPPFRSTELPRSSMKLAPEGALAPPKIPAAVETLLGETSEATDR